MGCKHWHEEDDEICMKNNRICSCGSEKRDCDYPEHFKQDFKLAFNLAWGTAKAVILLGLMALAVLFMFGVAQAADPATYYAARTVAETPGLPFNSLVVLVLGIAAWVGGK